MTHLVVFLLILGAQGAVTMPNAQDTAVQDAVTTLSNRLHVDRTEITLISATPVAWPDSSLGCPARGMVYTPSIVPGFRIMLEAAATHYEFHAGQGRIVECTGVTGAAPPPTRAAAPALAATDRARRDLAAMLKVEAAGVVVKQVRPWRTDDRCELPKEKAADDDMPVGANPPTFLVELSHGKTVWRYRATALRAWRCGEELQVSRSI